MCACYLCCNDHNTHTHAHTHTHTHTCMYLESGRYSEYVTKFEKLLIYAQHYFCNKMHLKMMGKCDWICENRFLYSPIIYLPILTIQIDCFVVATL